MRMNVARRGPSAINTAVTHEGAPAYVGSPEEQLRRSVMSCMLWEGNFYEDGESIADRIVSLIPKVPFESVAQIALSARSDMNLRHVPLLIVAHCFEHYSGRKVGDLVSRVIQRPDEAGELISIYRSKAGVKKTLPNQLKIGISRALHKFSEYQLAKWDTNSAAYSLADVVRLCHPRAGEDKDYALLLAKIANKEYIPDAVKERYGFGDVKTKLDTPDTWETNLSKGADKKETFTRLMQEKKLGAMALLRNLRGMTEAGVDPSIIKSALATAKVDRVLPFRFLAAEKFAPQFKAELNGLMLRGLEGWDKLSGRTAICVDVSGSMHYPVSEKSVIERIDAAAGLSILIREICTDPDVIVFGTTAAAVNPSLRGMALSDVIGQAANQVGHGTNIGLAVATAYQRNAERVIVVTDMQSHDAVGAPTSLGGYLINVASYQNSVGYGDWNRIDGWSEAIPKFILEVDKARQTQAS